ncbi:hypothetical protein STVA_16130 [Allostella vacuolata]|nr:hypothetical protein STVA_16130 [Stella vacuolata]
MLALAAAAVVRAGDPRLDPWLGFHRRVGVERFFLYATGGGAVPEAADITAVAWPFERPHRPAWDHCLFHHGAGAAWLAFLATDEFLFATDGEDLRMALAAFGRTPAVGVGRLLYGPQGRPGPLLRHAVRRASSDIVLALPAMLRSPGLDAERHESYRPLATRVAFVVQPARTHACRGRYDFAFRDEELAMTEEGRPVVAGWSERAGFERLRVNQYLGGGAESLRTRFADAVPAHDPAPSDDWAPFQSEIDTAVWPVAGVRAAP